MHTQLKNHRENKLRYELYQYPPYSPDLLPLTVLTPQKILSHFSSNEEIIAVVENYFEGLPECHFRDGRTNLEDR